jgi:molybdopterin synthase catalytic subunit
MQIAVRLFGSLREATGVKELSVSLAEGATLGVLQDLLAAEHPSFEAMAGKLRVAVNQEVTDDDVTLADGDEVAFLPPVSGGRDEAVCTLSDQPLDVGETVARVAGRGMGGIVTFVGTVRDASRGKVIEHLEYEAYPGMAEREMEKIAAEAGDKWPGSRVAVAHRVGHLEIGEIAVVVVAAAPHRAEAFAACRYTIDTLKERVPIWKKEVATDGASWVEDTP